MLDAKFWGTISCSTHSVWHILNKHDPTGSVLNTTYQVRGRRLTLTTSNSIGGRRYNVSLIYCALTSATLLQKLGRWHFMTNPGYKPGIDFTYSQRSSCVASVINVFTSGSLLSVLLNSISVWPSTQLDHVGVISVGSAWSLTSRNLTMDRKDCWKAKRNAELLKVTWPKAVDTL